MGGAPSPIRSRPTPVLSYPMGPRGRPSAGADMGIYDREYYRDETRGSGWLSGVAPACKALILINVGIYLAEIVFSDARLDELFAAHSRQIFRQGRVWQLLTAAFLHDQNNPFHLIWNMLFLWMAGREVESL